MMQSLFSSQQPNVPKTAAELDALLAMRRELESQLRNVTERRGQLAQERLNAEARVQAGGVQDRAIVKELEGRVAELGARSVRLEKELARADDMIAQARAAGVGVDVSGNLGEQIKASVLRNMEAANTRVIGVADEDVDRMRRNLERDYERKMILEGASFILLGAITARMVWNAAKRKFSQPAAAPGLANMQQALDVIAVEVERISEGQRYVTKKLAEQGHPAAEKVGIPISE